MRRDLDRCNNNETRVLMLRRRTLATAAAASLLLPRALRAETPRQGGTIRYMAPYGTSFSKLDILSSTITQDQIWAKALHRSLYNWDSFAKKPVLDLATSVTPSADGMTHTYKLRDDAYFHNGRKMTADDVIWTYNHIMTPANACSGTSFVIVIAGAADVQSGKAKTISGLRKIDDHTLQITLAQKTDPGYYLFDPTTTIYPATEATAPEFQSHPIGLGPYKFVEYVPGSRLVGERWEKFYIPGKPHADKVVISIMGDAAARDVAFRNGELDASLLGPTQYAIYSRDPKLSKRLEEVAEYYTRVIGFNPAYKPFSDRRVRQAINYAINSELIITRLAKGKAYRATGWLPISSSAYDASEKPYAYDPARAKKLLAEAGYPNGFTFECTATSNESWGVPIVEAAATMLGKVGVKVKIKPVESTVLDDVVVKGDFQAFMWSLQTGPDPFFALNQLASTTPPTGGNYVRYKNPHFDALLDQAAKANDDASRLALLKKADAVIHDDAPFWFFNYNKAVMAYQPWLHGLQPDANDLSLQNYEDMWVDASSPAAK